MNVWGIAARSRPGAALALAAGLALVGGGCPAGPPENSAIVYTCATTADCPYGQTCAGNRCVAVPPAVDSGGGSDAASDDRAGADANLDAHAVSDGTAGDGHADAAASVDATADAGDAAPVDRNGSDGASDRMQYDGVGDDRAAADAVAGQDGAADAARDATAPADASVPDAADASVPDAAPVCVFDAGPLPTWVDFTPQLAKRETVGGPFNVAALLQGSREDTCARGDAITAPRGSQIAGAFYEHFDSGQGSVVLWAVPEWDIGEVSDASRHLLRVGDFRVGVDGPQRGLFVQIGTARQLFAGLLGDWSAGSKHFVVVRWDVRHSFGNGTDHVAVTVDDQTETGLAQALTAPAVDSALIIGAEQSDGTGAVGALIEGLTIYRRPLRDATGGVDVGVANELTAIYRGGPPHREPTLVTGAWDVVFALPTNGESELIGAPSGEAFALPFSANALGTPGYLQNAAALAAWTTIGTATSSTAIAQAEAIYGGGAAVHTVDAQRGLDLEWSNSAGFTAFVARAVVHSDGASVPELVIRDAAQNVVGRRRGTLLATRTAPDTLIVTASIPATATAWHVQVVNTAAANSRFYLHQVELFANGLRNPSFETGSGTPWVPTSWINESPGSNPTSQETGTVHSGNSALLVDAVDTGSDFKQIIQTPQSFNQLGRFYAAGAHFWWRRGQAPQLSVTNGCFFSLSGPPANNSKFQRSGTAASGTWQHVQGVGRRHWQASNGTLNCWNEILRFGGTWRSSIAVVIDDAYVVALEPVALTALPADLASSLSPAALRVDGEDLTLQPVTGLTQRSGRIAVQLARPHDLAASDLFCPNDSALLTLWGDGDDHIMLRARDDGGIRLDANFTGWSCDYSVTGNVLGDGLLHDLVVSYARNGDVLLTIDGVQRAQCSMGVNQFSTVPTLAIYGTDYNGQPRCDVLVGRNGAVFSAS